MLKKMFQEEDDFKTMVEKYQQKYNYRPEPPKEDTKTFLIKALLKTYTFAIPGNDGLLGFFKTPPRKYKSRVTHILIHRNDIRSYHGFSEHPHGMKNRQVYLRQHGCTLYLNSPDVHSALQEVSAHTGIRFTYGFASFETQQRAEFGYFAYTVTYPPHLVIEDTVETEYVASDHEINGYIPMKSMVKN